MMKDMAIVYGVYSQGKRPAEYYVESDAFTFQIKALNESHALAVAKAAFPFLNVHMGEGIHEPSRKSSGIISVSIEK